MELTQPLGVGLGLVVRINNQYSHPVFMGQCLNIYATINECRKFCRVLFAYSVMFTWDQENAGMLKPCGRCAEKADRQVAVYDITNESHKMMAQINHTNQLHK